MYMFKWKLQQCMDHTHKHSHENITLQNKTELVEIFTG